MVDTSRIKETFFFELNDDIKNFSFPIEGLKVEQNCCVDEQFVGDIKISKTASSCGPLISDYVTHEKAFLYGTYGIHIGQDDRLFF